VRDTGGGDTGPDAGDSAVPDTSIGDTSIPDGGPTGDCRITDMLAIHTEPMSTFREVELSLGAGVDGFLVGYALERGGQQNFYTRHVGTSGATVGAEENVSGLAGAMPPNMAVGGTSIGLGADGWLNLWSDTRDDSGPRIAFDIQMATAASGGGGVSAVSAVTNNEDADNRPSVQQTADGFLVVWNHLPRGAGMVPEAYRVTLGADGSMTGTPDAVPGMTGMAGRVALGALTDGVAAAWVEEGATSAMRDVRVLAMDRDGTPRGTPTTVTLSPNAAGIVDYAGVIDGGGVVYDYLVAMSRNEVRYRAIDADGNTASEPKSLIPAGSQGRAPSIGILSGAALVAYRSDDRTDGISIQLVVIDGFGNEMARAMVAPIEEWLNGEVHVAFTPTGQGLVVWNDEVGSDYVVSGARIDCSETP